MYRLPALSPLERWTRDFFIRGWGGAGDSRISTSNIKRQGGCAPAHPSPPVFSPASSACPSEPTAPAAPAVAPSEARSSSSLCRTHTVQIHFSPSPDGTGSAAWSESGQGSPSYVMSTPSSGRGGGLVQSLQSTA